MASEGAKDIGTPGLGECPLEAARQEVKRGRGDDARALDWSEVNKFCCSYCTVRYEGWGTGEGRVCAFTCLARRETEKLPALRTP